MNSKITHILLSIIVGLVTILAVFTAIGITQEQEYFGEPVARGGTIWATKAYTTSTMTISSSAITISNTSFNWSATDLTDAEVAVVSVHTQAVNIMWDGNDPTSTKGQNIAAAGTVTIRGTDNIANLRFIRSGGSDGVVSVTLEK